MIILQLFIFSKDINFVSLSGLIFGHIIFAIGITQLLDWSWLKNLMSEEEKQKMLYSYSYKDFIVDGAIFAVFIGMIFLVISQIL